MLWLVAIALLPVLEPIWFSDRCLTKKFLPGAVIERMGGQGSVVNAYVGDKKPSQDIASTFNFPQDFIKAMPVSLAALREHLDNAGKHSPLSIYKRNWIVILSQSSFRGTGCPPQAASWNSFEKDLPNLQSSSRCVGPLDICSMMSHWPASHKVPHQTYILPSYSCKSFVPLAILTDCFKAYVLCNTLCLSSLFKAFEQSVLLALLAISRLQ